MKVQRSVVSALGNIIKRIYSEQNAFHVLALPMCFLSTRLIFLGLEGFCLKFYDPWLGSSTYPELWELMAFSGGTTLGTWGSSQMPGKEKPIAHIST